MAGTLKINMFEFCSSFISKQCTSIWFCVECGCFLGVVVSFASKLISHATLALLFGVTGAESDGGGGTTVGGGGGGNDRPSRESSEKSS